MEQVPDRFRYTVQTNKNRYGNIQGNRKIN